MDEPGSELPVFRSVKRRKVHRKRREEDDLDLEQQRDTPAGSRSKADNKASAPASDSDDEDPGLPSLVKARRANKNRGHGIEFSSATSRLAMNGDQPAPQDGGELLRPQGIPDRFVGQTGQAVDVDKHMIEYIESELAKRKRLQEEAADALEISKHASSSTLTGSILPQRQPASLGKLHEVDLGETATLRNLKETEAAIRRARGEEVPPEEPPPTRKPRLGRNGKPRRGPKRRNSEDIARDKMVEDLLRENRPDIHNESSAVAPEVTESPGDDAEADERLAETFRQQFYESMQSRHRTRRAAPTRNPNDPLRGPKLGGSRSARAAMHRHLEATGAVQKK